MNLNEASKILCIDNVIECDEAVLKKSYRKLMRKNHPDIGGSTQAAQLIIEAYNYVNQLRSEYAKQKAVNSVARTPTIVIGFEDLIDILKGGKVRLAESGEYATLNKSNIGRFNVLVLFNLTLIVDGNPTVVSRYIYRDALDNYTVQCKVYVDDTKVESTVTTDLGSKHIEFNAIGSRFDYLVNYDNLAKIRISLERCIYSGRED